MNQFYSNRRYTIGAIFLVICLIYLGKLFGIQVLDPRYKLSADNNVFRKVVDYPARGLVFDRNQKLLVYNEASYDLLAVPNQITPFDTLELCSILGITIESFREELKKAIDYAPYKPSVLFKQLTKRRYAFLDEKIYKFPGFYVQSRSARKYNYSTAAHLLGYVREADKKLIEQNPYYKSGDYIGISGIEKAYEEYLRGSKGSKIYVVDALNRIKGGFQNGRFDTAAVVGLNVTSTIDVDLQMYAESLMVNKLGSVVVIEPATGEVLTLVSAPYYDPNLLIGSDIKRNYPKLANDNLKPMFNRALMAYYPPGSTFKLVNALIGLEEEVIDYETSFSCGGGFNIGNHIVKCHHGGSVNFLYSIQGSCNSYYCNVFARILNNKKYSKIDDSYTAWRNYVFQFGLGRKLNSDLNQELAGIVYSTNHYNKYYGKGKWKAYTLISMGIGQGELGFTPFQMANMTAAIANRGFYYIPHVVKKIDGIDNIDKRFTEKQIINIKREYFEKVIEGMELVVKSGTATVAYFEGISICGKTGTAQNPHGEDHSIFVAFAPKDNPKIAVSVYIENAGFGSTYAAPIASLIIEKYLTGKITRQPLEKRIVETNLIFKPPLKLEK